MIQSLRCTHQSRMRKNTYNVASISNTLSSFLSNPSFYGALSAFAHKLSIKKWLLTIEISVLRLTYATNRRAINWLT